MLSEAVKSQPMRFTGAVMYAFSPIPQKVPFYDGSGGPFLYAKMSRLLCLKEASGFEGWIPCSPIMENTLLPLILTGETKTYAEWRHHVYWQCRNAGFSGETAGEVGRLDYAMLDILARRAGLPMHRFLGADTDSVIVYGSGGSIHLEGDALAEEMERFLSFGHKTVKMKVAGFFGTQLDRDVERVKLVREVIGPDVKLALDANQVFTVEEALAFFDKVPRIRRKLQTLHDVGLDYIRLGQPSTQLSGGEAQRIKLAAELSKKATGRTIYILDEPTTGLHFEDVRKLIGILQRLRDQGNTLVVIEHNLDVIKTADYIIDMGPEGGDGGGTVIAEGTPEEITEVPGSWTGKYLRPYLERDRNRTPEEDAG